MKFLLLSAAVFSLVAAPASAQSSTGIEVQDVAIEVSIVDDLAIVRISVKIRNWATADRIADLKFSLPKDAVMLELDSVGPIEADIEAVLKSSKARTEVLKLLSVARKLRSRKNGTVMLRTHSAFFNTRRRAPPRRRVSRSLDPQLLERVGTHTYRLRIFPITPAKKKEDGKITPGLPQTADLTYVVPLKTRRPEAHIDWRQLKIPFWIHGTFGRRTEVPDARVTIKLPPCKTLRSIKRRGKKLDQRGIYVHTTLRNKRPLNVVMKFDAHPTVATGNITVARPRRCTHAFGYDLEWIRSCMRASERIDELRKKGYLTKDELREVVELGMKHKLVTRWTSILIAHTVLYEIARRDPPEQSPDRLRGPPRAK